MPACLPVPQFACLHATTTLPIWLRSHQPKCSLFILCSKSLGLSPLEQLEAEKKERETKITKTESEMEQVFDTKVKEKRKKLKELEAEVWI